MRLRRRAVWHRFPPWLTLVPPLPPLPNPHHALACSMWCGGCCNLCPCPLLTALPPLPPHTHQPTSGLTDPGSNLLLLSAMQDVVWCVLYQAEGLLEGSWLRRKALSTIMEHIHYEDENTRYVDIGPVNKVVNMLACWLEDPNGEAFKK